MRKVASSLALGAAAFLAPSAARAEDTSALPTRIAVLPTVGVGLAKVTNSSPYPGFIGLTTLGGEVHVEVPPYGGFFRFQFHSSGLDGRWTAPSFALGGSYRLFGDAVERLSLLARGGILYERWHAATPNDNCPIDFFVPSNCKALQPTAPTGVILNTQPVDSTTGDVLGLFGGLRAELPLSRFYVAFDGEISGGADLTSSVPGAMFELRVAALVGFKDARRPDARTPETPRNKRGL
jgi:hypothetical protein